MAQDVVDPDSTFNLAVSFPPDPPTPIHLIETTSAPGMLAVVLGQRASDDRWRQIGQLAPNRRRVMLARIRQCLNIMRVNYSFAMEADRDDFPRLMQLVVYLHATALNAATLFEALQRAHAAGHLVRAIADEFVEPE